MVKHGYPLDYLNVEYNIEEANKKINEVLERAEVLNLEDSLLELKVLNEYFDSLYTEFEKEKNARDEYEEGFKNFNKKIGKTVKLVYDIFNQLDKIKELYDLKEEDTAILFQIKDDIDSLDKDFKVLKDHTGNMAFAYTKIVKEMESLNQRLATAEENLDNYLDTIGSMKDDESRAKQQLEEVRQILKDSRFKLRTYNLPVIPRSYFVELKEANEALKEIVNELSKKPINIDVLNTRVDTGRDLALKLCSKTQNMLKIAKLAETAIVYGNRYRSKSDSLNDSLLQAEELFYNGDYSKSLNITINDINKVEQGIYNKLTNFN